MTLKVWCDDCEGTGKDQTGRHPLGDCPACNGDGYTFLATEVIGLGPGRAVVVVGDVIRDVSNLVDEHAHLTVKAVSDGARPPSGPDCARLVLRALFGGRDVYEAEAVGRLEAPTPTPPTTAVDIHGIVGIRHENGAWTRHDDGDLVAVGLKEVGR